MNEKTFISIFIIFVTTLLCFSSQYIVIPFKELNKEIQIPKSSLDASKFFKYYYQDPKYSLLSIGEPYQTVNFNILMNNYLFFIGEGLCFENQKTYEKYVEFQSKKFLKIFRFKSPLEEYKNILYMNEKFTFFSDLNLQKNTTVDKFFMIYGENYEGGKNEVACGEIGLKKVNTIEGTDKDSFLENLNLVKLVEKNVWTYHYFININEQKENDELFKELKKKGGFDKFDGVVVFGQLPHEYGPKNFNKDDLVISASDQVLDHPLNWNINFRDIYFYTSEKPIYMQEAFVAELNLDINYIQASQEYFDIIVEKFFMPYISNQVCFVDNGKSNGNKYEMIYCDEKSFKLDDMKKFPTLYFNNYHLGYIFTLSFVELFEQIDGKIVFLMVKNLDKKLGNIWQLGKVFMQKYHCTFDFENSNIGIYLKKEIKSNKSKLFLEKYKDIDIDKEILMSKKEDKIIEVTEEECSNGHCGKFKAVVVILLIVTLLVGIFIGRKCFNKKRRVPRSNELEEEFGSVNDYKNK